MRRTCGKNYFENIRSFGLLYQACKLHVCNYSNINIKLRSGENPKHS